MPLWIYAFMDPSRMYIINIYIFHLIINIKGRGQRSYVVVQILTSSLFPKAFKNSPKKQYIDKVMINKRQKTQDLLSSINSLSLLQLRQVGMHNSVIRNYVVCPTLQWRNSFTFLLLHPHIVLLLPPDSKDKMSMRKQLPRQRLLV